MEKLQEPLSITHISTGIKDSIVSSSVRERVGDYSGVGNTAETAVDRNEELEGLGGTIIWGRGEAADNGAPGFEMGKIARAEHGVDN